MHCCQNPKIPKIRIESWEKWFMCVYIYDESHFKWMFDSGANVAIRYLFHRILGIKFPDPRPWHNRSSHLPNFQLFDPILTSNDLSPQTFFLLIILLWLLNSAHQTFAGDAATIVYFICSWVHYFADCVTSMGMLFLAWVCWLCSYNCAPLFYFTLFWGWKLKY